MSAGASHRDLIVWQKSMDLVVKVYELARMLPPDERFAMSSQMTRAAVSIPANIAEGKGRGTPGEYVQFLRIARGSLMELDTYVELICRLGYVNLALTTLVRDLITEVGKMLSAMKSRLQPSRNSRSP